jgi:hypothetical protein
LKKKRLLKEYVDNTLEKNDPNRHPVTMRYVKNHDILDLISGFKDSIDYSFIWANTPQGHDFWQQLAFEFETKYYMPFLQEKRIKWKTR